MTTKAQRQAKWRLRRKLGRRVLAVDVAEAELVDALIRSGRLSEDEALDDAAISREAALVIGEWSRLWRAERC
jgi:hypothetical protein